MNERNVNLGIMPSKIREIFEYAKNRKKEIGIDQVFDFSIGNPNAPAPKEVKESLISLLNNTDPVKLHGYTSNNGDKEVRDEIAKYLNKTYHTELSGDYIFLTCGAAAGLAITFNTLLLAGDEVVTFAPHFPDYRVTIENIGAKLITCKTDDKFLPDYQDLENKINDKTIIVLYNSPNNPTGVFYDEEVIKNIVNVVRRKSEEYGRPIYILSDEPYRELLFDDQKYPFITNYYENSLVTYSFSKSASLPGERIGYIVINPKCHDAYKIYKGVCGSAWSLGYIAAPSLFQFLIPFIQGHTSDLDFYKKNRDELYNTLKEIGYEVTYPSGAFYMFVKALEDDANKFCETAKEYELLFVPSDSFGVKGYVRIAYCVNYQTIKNSKEAFRKLYQRYKGEK